MEKLFTFLLLIVFILLVIFGTSSIVTDYQINNLKSKIDILEMHIKNEHMICQQSGEFIPESLEQASKDAANISQEEGKFTIINGMGAYQTKTYTIFPLLTIDPNWSCFLIRKNKVTP